MFARPCPRCAWRSTIRFVSSSRLGWFPSGSIFKPQLTHLFTFPPRRMRRQNVRVAVLRGRVGSQRPLLRRVSQARGGRPPGVNSCHQAGFGRGELLHVGAGIRVLRIGMAKLLRVRGYRGKPRCVFRIPFLISFILRGTLLVERTQCPEERPACEIVAANVTTQAPPATEPAIIGGDYCVWGPDYECYDSGWPSCCGSEDTEVSRACVFRIPFCSRSF